MARGIDRARRLRAPRPESDLPDLRPACPAECGPGHRCVWCMAEIRAEALEWIRELNAAPMHRTVVRDPSNPDGWRPAERPSRRTDPASAAN